MNYPEAPTPYLSIKEFPADEQPREKLQAFGPSALTDAELLAIILRTGTERLNVLDTARTLLREFNGLAFLARKSAKELQQIQGIGSVKAITLLAVFELGRRIAQSALTQRPHLNGEDVAVEFVRPLLRDLPTEHFYALYLDNAMRLISTKKLSEGAKTGTLVDVQLLVKEAVLHDATGVIVAHNHPSGTTNPSKEDELLTKQVQRALLYFRIKLVDHIIIAGNAHFSFAGADKIKPMKDPLLDEI